jgi:hypothetical protein
MDFYERTSPKTKALAAALIARLPTVEEWARELDEEAERSREEHPPEDGEPLCW